MHLIVIIVAAMKNVQVSLELNEKSKNFSLILLFSENPIYFKSI